jgi:RNA polymerase sigma-70 factor (ECF subfamily)
LASSVDEKIGIDLIKRISAKDRKAFEEFYYLYAEGFGRFLMKMLKNPDWVDEAVNDVMLTVWQTAERYNADLGRLSTWLFGIAHNKGLKTLERYARNRDTVLSEFSVPDDDDETASEQIIDKAQPTHVGPEQTVMGWQLGEAMSWAFDRLSQDHQTVIELCFSEGFSYEEMATIMDCPVNTVKTRLFHARKRLSDMLARKGYHFADLNGASS